MENNSIEKLTEDFNQIISKINNHINF